MCFLGWWAGWRPWYRFVPLFDTVLSLDRLIEHPRWYCVVATIHILKEANEVRWLDVIKFRSACFGFLHASIHERSEWLRHGCDRSGVDHKDLLLFADLEGEEVRLDQTTDASASTSAVNVT
jgi:hypothetical protein